MRVQLESPFAGDVPRNRAYALRCLRHSLELGESPFASHLLYPFVLNDEIATDRAAGLKAAFDWLSVAEGMAVYTDYGTSPGMKLAVRRARARHIWIVYRKIGVNP